MSVKNPKDAARKAKTRQISISMGKYGSIVTIAVMACQFLEQVLFVP